MAKSSFFAATGFSPTTTSSIQTSLATIATQATAIDAALDEFTDLYLGRKAVAPSLDNDGNALTTGTLYFSTTLSELQVYKDGGWKSITAEGSLLRANNLSGLTSVTTARANMGLGDIATTSVADYLGITATLEGGNF